MHAAWIMAVWLTGAALGDKPSIAVMPRVRAAHGVDRVLSETAARSAIVRDLIERLAATDVIVYVEITGSPDVQVARTTLVAATASGRFLRIGISGGVSRNDWPALLGHELQHVVEIAEHAEVRDDNAVRRLYAAIGREHGTDRFETDEAVRVERLVRNELRR